MHGRDLHGTRATTSGPACSPAGENCNGPADCCSQVCNSSESSSSRARSAACRVQGELCVTGADCCSSQCAPDKSGALRCAALAACTMADTKPCPHQVGDVCKNSDECCSRACVATSDGVSRCVPSAGCRPGCDTCDNGSDCCSNSCQRDASGIARCAVPSACLPEGEVCSTDPQCCTDAGPTKCVEDPIGLKANRCKLKVQVLRACLMERRASWQVDVAVGIACPHPLEVTPVPRFACKRANLARAAPIVAAPTRIACKSRASARATRRSTEPGHRATPRHKNPHNASRHDRLARTRGRLCCQLPAGRVDVCATRVSAHDGEPSRDELQTKGFRFFG